MHIRLIHAYGAPTAAVAFGRRVLARSSTVLVSLPGAFVWDGLDHDLREGRWIPTRLAWARGTEPTVALCEKPFWAPLAGIDERPAVGWATIDGVDVQVS